MAAAQFSLRLSSPKPNRLHTRERMVISTRREKPIASPDDCSSLRVSRRAKRCSPGMRPYSSSGRTSLVGAAKRAAASKAQAGIPRRENQPRTILDDPAGTSAQIRSLKWEPKKRCEARVARREKKSLAILDYNHPAYAQVPSRLQNIPIWRAKRLRSALNRYVQFDSNQNVSEASEVTLFESELILCGFRRDWANLGEGPVGLIAERLLANDVADYIRFRAVCRPWRRGATDPRAHDILDRRFHPRQWVMIRETLTTPHCRRFLNVSTGHCICIDLPELQGNHVFGPTAEGLLVLLHRTSFLVRLLNPLTRQSADLPPATTLLSQIDFAEVCDTKEDFEVSVAGLADNSTFAVNFTRIETVAVAKPGDENWIVIDHGSTIFTALSFAGRFYCVTDGAIMVVETSVDQPPQLVMVADLVRNFSRMMEETLHLVDNDGELMLVYRKHNGNNSRKYEVHRVDLDARNIVIERGLGERAVFIGIERALSVSPLVFPTIRANAIYLGFHDRITGRSEKSPCDLMDGTAELLRDVCDSINGMPLYGPGGVDHYLSCCVTGYDDEAEGT